MLSHSEDRAAWLTEENTKKKNLFAKAQGNSFVNFLRFEQKPSSGKNGLYQLCCTTKVLRTQVDFYVPLKEI